MTTKQVTIMTCNILLLSDRDFKKVQDNSLAFPICTAVLDLQKALGISRPEKHRERNQAAFPVTADQEGVASFY